MVSIETQTLFIPTYRANKTSFAIIFVRKGDERLKECATPAIQYIILKYLYCDLLSIFWRIDTINEQIHVLNFISRKCVLLLFLDLDFFGCWL